MNLKEYTIEAKKTMTYKTNKELLACTSLSLCGELVEYFEFANEISVRGKNRTLLIKELGDLLWYFSILSDHLNLKLDTDSVSKYYNLESCGFTSVGKIQEVIKKSIRDKDWVPDETDIGKLQILFSELLYGIEVECAIRQLDLSTILETNVEKLASRKERGVLGGDGNER